MRKTRPFPLPTLLLVAAILAAGPGPAVAGDPPPPHPGKKEGAGKPKPVVMDETTRTLWKAFLTKSYNLARAGVRKASFKVKVRLTVAVLDKSVEGTAFYRFDGKKGKLTWDVPELGAALARQGFSAERLDFEFREDAWAGRLAGCRLVAENREDGTTKVVVKGEQKEGIRAFVFDREGRISKMIMGFDPGTGVKRDLPVRLSYAVLDGKYALRSFRFEIDLPGRGRFTEVSTVTYTKVGAYHVRAKLVSVETLAGKPLQEKVFEFSDWKFNDDVK